MKSHLMILGVASAAISMSVNIVKADDALVSVARVVKVGDVSRYKTTINTSVTGMDIIASTTSKSTVKEINKDGNIVTEEVSEGGTVSIGGNEQERPASPPMKQIRTPLGKLIEYKPNEAAQAIMTLEVQKLIAMIHEPFFATKKVKAAESWETELENPVMAGKKFKVKTTFTGNDKLDGVDVFKVVQNTSVDVDKEGGKLVQEITYLLDPATGETLKADGTTKGLPTNFGPMDWKIKIAKVKSVKN